MLPMLPMLATATTAPPRGAQWAHEIKWDGMRVLAEVRGPAVTLTSRNGNDVTASFPELAGLAGTYDDLLLDGEVVAFDQGRPSFAALAERMHVKDRRKAERLAGTRPVTYVVFDVLRLFGQDLTSQPWSARRPLLDQLDLGGSHVQVPPAYDDGEQLLAATAEQGLEGVVSKRRAAAYFPGRRSADWLKTSHRATLSAVVGGWRPETGNANRLERSSSAGRGLAVWCMRAGWAAGWRAVQPGRWRTCSRRWSARTPPLPTRCPPWTPER